MRSDVCLPAGASLTHLKAHRRSAAAFLLVANLIPALYTGLIHQRGTLDVMIHIQKLCDVKGNSTHPQPDVLFLMPCHSTPFYRYSIIQQLQMSCPQQHFDFLFEAEARSAHQVNCTLEQILV